MNWKKISLLSLFASFLIPAVLAAEAWDGFGTIGGIAAYIFGEMTNVATTNISNAIITIAVWLLIFVTFGDIIKTFSTFSAWVSWCAALLISIIAANLGGMTTIIAKTTGIFATFGTISVYLGLAVAFVVFILVNLGITTLGPWIMGRKAMIEASKMKAGGTETAGAIRGIKEMGKALKEGQ